MSDARLHVLGAGSIGLLMAAGLARGAGLAPLLIRRTGSEPARRRVYELREGESVERVSLPQSAAEALAGPVRRLLVCTKAQDVLPALESLGAALDPAAVILLLHNGMGVQQAVARRWPGCAVAAGTTTEGAYRPAPDRLVHAGRGLTRLGRLQGEGADWAAWLNAAGFRAEWAEPIEYHLADKLRVNALINPLTVLHDCRNGELLERPAALARMQVLGEEADRVLAAAGWQYPRPAFEAACAVARATGANYSSMHQDARAGRTLEIAAINGYLLALARAHRLPAPAHAALMGEFSTS
ncbi:ketopantoate reductase family protein [Alkalilimnicola sp. S0819]|uniref:ketopantoate reductase family protein n=1 Tax=Alkalilimnicola sp. S0819 TaxID=2613922 RepID=UPI00126164A9|nr:2-dehydropantoate 2-reductase [Alkalilimnicola sp. S0819]KAB7624300.1 2-dehydropantoate 2-reductase [Alkalilimnicola sp. S0819]MPQ16124.1 2-dehydropantoate 2-reductase [Alkalilimnicola sp. S0819]